MRYILICVCLFIVFGCSKPEHPILVDDDKSIAILVDLNLANIAVRKYPVGLRDSMAAVYKSQICGFHDINVTEIDTLLWQMQADFVRYNKLYLKVKDSLLSLETKLGQRDEEKPKLKYEDIQDSLKNANQ